MIQLDVLRLLEENGKTKYWLYKQLGMSYQNFSRMVNNQTKSIRYENIETMCLLLILTFNKNKIFIEGAPLTRCTFQRINRRKGVPYSIRRTYGAIKSSLGKVYFLSNASIIYG